jgi:glycosyltransferase involved in cell wall biosynthesis
MQMGRPVIACAVGGLPEIVVEGKTGLLVPPKKPMALYKAMEKLLQSPEIAIQMGVEGRRLAREKFTLDNNASQYIKNYENLILDRRFLAKTRRD